MSARRRCSLFRSLAAAALALGCASEPGPGNMATDASDALDATDVSDAAMTPVSCSVDGSKALATPTPLLVTGFERVFAPAGTRYLNDHTLIRAPDGVWHVFGITDSSPGNPQAERAFLHATSMDLMGPWREEPDALTSMGDETAIWAPHVVEVSRSHWAMYYFPNAPDGRIRRADSDDLFHWTRTTLSAPGGRDPYLVHDVDRWRLYSVGVSPSSHGRIVMSESRDLTTWSDPVPVIEDPAPGFGWGNLESPFVVRRGDLYYLFLTRTSEAYVDYARTVAFASRDPSRFEWEPLAEYPAHAAEVVDDGHHLWLTSGGWTGYVGERWRGLSIARLAWATCIEH